MKVNSRNITGAILILALTYSQITVADWQLSIEECGIWNDNTFAEETVSWSGSCVNGKASGYGISIWTWKAEDDERLSDRYEGLMIKGRKQGKGFYQYANGNRYIGDFRNGFKHGNGVFYFFASGNTYEGQFDSGDRHGVGKFLFAKSGNLYIGQFKYDQKNGTGAFQWADGTRFSGSYSGDLAVMGECHFNDGRKTSCNQNPDSSWFIK
ncbi:MAG: hypothetical protein ACI8P9_000868 [Parasphingorhabdus sp.]|jgi:hypothetical protein